ncbi:hypothetical protein [Mucilaginibacter pineti]|uniref:hypothetical protein n=1 Tax=Mucilaginibacter pineti TaxID=1391627 RepID=UPI000B8745C1|nr:hypothetical protein [Mucilaginibacter pineti]
MQADDDSDNGKEQRFQPSRGEPGLRKRYRDDFDGDGTQLISPARLPAYRLRPALNHPDARHSKDQDAKHLEDRSGKPGHGARTCQPPK